jgi:L-threonylcarbamoyladenylate synthase
VESTVLQINDDHAVLLRPGTIAAEDFAPFIADLKLPETTTKISAPGMLASHYAPRAQVRLNAVEAGEGEVLLGFGEVTGDLNLSETGDCAEAAHNLYDYLRRLDREDVQTIVVAPIPKHGLGLAINDRLKRAAADR